MNGWHTHFGLTDDPFDAGGERFRYYYGARFGVFSLRLERAFGEQRGFVAVTGPAGSGKSTLVRTVLSRTDVCVHATVSAAHSAPVAVIDALLRSREPLDGGFSATRKRAALLELIERARESGRPIVCVVDDAHLATVGQLNELFSAIDITPDAHTALQLVLIGRSRLLLTLQARTLGGLATRIATRIETEPLSPAEIADYLTERLESSGAPDPSAIFSPLTMTAVARHSRGSIAVAATLARASLTRAAEAGASSVSCEIVDEAAGVYAGSPSEAERLSTSRITATTVSAAAAALVALALIIAAAQVKMAGRRSETVEANVVHLEGLAKSGKSRSAPAPTRLAEQRGTPRETFLPNRPYEVQIKPPRRPTQSPAGGSTPPATGAAAATASPSRAETAGGGDESGGAVDKGADKGPSPSGSKPAPSSVESLKKEVTPSPAPKAQSAEPPPSAPSVAGIAKPWSSLQVGAFRNLKSAHALQRKLARSFSDVYISTVESGGEPLYRVRVGRFRTADDSLGLKARLQASGYPSFRVTEN